MLFLSAEHHFHSEVFHAIVCFVEGCIYQYMCLDKQLYFLDFDKAENYLWGRLKLTI